MPPSRPHTTTHERKHRRRLNVGGLQNRDQWFQYPIQHAKRHQHHSNRPIELSSGTQIRFTCIIATIIEGWRHLGFSNGYKSMRNNASCQKRCVTLSGTHQPTWLSAYTDDNYNWDMHLEKTPCASHEHCFKINSPCDYIRNNIYNLYTRMPRIKWWYI